MLQIDKNAKVDVIFSEMEGMLIEERAVAIARRHAVNETLTKNNADCIRAECVEYLPCAKAVDASGM